MVKSTKRILISGGRKRVGKEIAKYFAKKGYEVIVHHNSDLTKENLEEFAEWNIKYYQCDFNDLILADKMIAKIVNKFGQIDVLINNACYFENDTNYNFQINDFAKAMNINFITPAILIKEFCKQKNITTNFAPIIICMLDSYIYEPPKDFYSYSLSKMALANLIKINAKLIAPNFRINGISLGPVLKSIRQSESNFNNMIKQAPMQRVININEINELIFYLIGAQNITGEIISIDGGRKYVKTV